MRIRADFTEEEQPAKRRRMAPMWPESWEALAAVDRTHQHDPQNVTRENLGMRERAFVDPDRLLELIDSSETGAVQMASLAKQWERRQAITVRLLRQQLEALEVQRAEAERKHRLILEGPSSPRTTGNIFGAKGDVGEPVCPMDEEDTSSSGATSSQSSSAGSIGSSLVDDNENSLEYWKAKAKRMGQLLAESLQREQDLLNRLQESPSQTDLPVPLEDLKDHLNRLDNFLHFTLRKAPIVIAHQDTELRYRFIFNPFPGLKEDAILGKTDLEINRGPGVEECMDFKREVLKLGRPMQREFDFYTELFGQKTFMVTVEPVISKSGEMLGVNYLALDVSEEAARREKLIVLREEVAVQKAMETELHRTLVITEEAMRAKQMLATMSHEIRSPLSGVVSMAQVLATTKLDAEQRPMVDLMNSSGEHVLELINDILDLSRAESGAMRLEAKKFRPRLVVKCVLQLATASVQNKNVTLAGHVAEDVPEEVIGDVLRIRQVLTNLISNAIKFTPQGEVTIKVRLVSPPVGSTASSHHKSVAFQTESPTTEQESNESTETVTDNELKSDVDTSDISRSSSSLSTMSSLSSVASTTLSTSSSISIKSVEDAKGQDEAGSPSTFPAVVWDLSPKSYEMTGEIWLHCEVKDTGIGIPEQALPSLFEEYTQASTTTARKYGGTGLGLAICKQLVGLMGGTLEVKSRQYVGSSFSFTLPLRSVKERSSDEPVIDNDVLRKPTAHPQGFEGKGKGLRGMDGKLKQRLRDSKRSWINSLGESTLFGLSRTAADKSLPQVALVEDNRQGSSSDVVGSSSSQVSTAQKIEPIEKCVENPKTLALTLDTMKTNILKKSVNCLKLTTAAESVVQKVVSASPAAEPRKRGSPRILLAEDNNVNVVVAQSMLKKLGLSLEVVNNGAEAVEALQRSDYDLVLMDVSMPVMDGLEATRLIRKLEEANEMGDAKGQSPKESSNVSSSCTVLPSHHSETVPTSSSTVMKRTPIIALTANAMAENVAECYNNGMDSFIAKPVTFEKLEKVLNQHIPWSNHRRIQAR